MTRTTIEVQQATNASTYRMSREMLETNPITVEFFPNASSPDAPVGVVFLSARDANNTFQCHPISGRPIWQKAVGYFLDTDPEFGADNVQGLYRAEIVPAGLPFPDLVTPSSLAVSTATLRSSGQNRQLVAHGVLAPSASRPHGGFDVYSEFADGSKTYDLPSSPVYMDLELINYRSGNAAWIAGQDNSNSIVSHLRLDLRD